MSDPLTDADLRNPFRSEADAFRVLVIVAIAGAIIVAGAVLVGTWLGVVLGLIAIALAIRSIVGWLRVALQDREEDPDGEPFTPPGPERG